MKNLIILVSVLCLLSFSEKGLDKAEQLNFDNNIENFDWLLGSWKRSNESEGLQTFEHWKKINETELMALGYTLKASDTVWQESLKLIKTEEEWNYIVQLQNAKSPTVFKVTKIELNSFTCENPDNDFPKKIRYTRVEKGINAVISGDGKVMLFEFEKAS